MSKDFGMLSHHWNGSVESIQGWLCSRKYNGWSVIWDGGITRGMLADEVPWYHKGRDKPTISTGLWSLGRKGIVKVIHAPDEFIDKFPVGVPTHGEIWFRDKLDVVKRTLGFKQYFKPMWGNLVYMAFNYRPRRFFKNPNSQEKLLWYFLAKQGLTMKENQLALDRVSVAEDRDMTIGFGLSLLRQFENDVFQVIKTVIIKNEEKLISLQKTAKDNGWEGLMFANPNGSYEVGRSYNSLKWKQTYETEALVTGYNEAGINTQYAGQYGSIQGKILWDEKIESVVGGNKRFVGQEVSFAIKGLNEGEREPQACERKYPIGSKISIRYLGVSSHGVPQSVNIYRGM